MLLGFTESRSLLEQFDLGAVNFVVHGNNDTVPPIVSALTGKLPLITLCKAELPRSQISVGSVLAAISLSDFVAKGAAYERAASKAGQFAAASEALFRDYMAVPTVLAGTTQVIEAV